MINRSNKQTVGPSEAAKDTYIDLQRVCFKEFQIPWSKISGSKPSRGAIIEIKVNILLRYIAIYGFMMVENRVSLILLNAFITIV